MKTLYTTLFLTVLLGTPLFADFSYETIPGYGVKITWADIPAKSSQECGCTLQPPRFASFLIDAYSIDEEIEVQYS